MREIVRESMQQASFRHLRLLGGIWGSYIVGAICGSALELHVALSALVFPLCVLAVLIVIDVFRPFEARLDALPKYLNLAQSSGSVLPRERGLSNRG
jgi:uncharacterized membrane protein YoaK (UPF0700 family)